jgi:hypothetical protein
MALLEFLGVLTPEMLEKRLEAWRADDRNAAGTVGRWQTRGSKRSTR